MIADLDKETQTSTVEEKNGQKEYHQGFYLRVNITPLYPRPSLPPKHMKKKKKKRLSDSDASKW